MSPPVSRACRRGVSVGSARAPVIIGSVVDGASVRTLYNTIGIRNQKPSVSCCLARSWVFLSLSTVTVWQKRVETEEAQVSHDECFSGSQKA